MEASRTMSLTNNLREECVRALTEDAPVAQLLEIVVRHKNEGISQRDTYDVLEGIWKELCSRNAIEDQQRCERLECIMDRVWGYCNKSQSIWEGSLSDGVQ